MRLRIYAQHLRIDAWLADFERKHGPIPEEIEVWDVSDFKALAPPGFTVMSL